MTTTKEYLEHYVGTLTEVGLNYAKLKVKHRLHSKINYAKVGKLLLIDAIDDIIVCKVIKTFIPESKTQFIETQLNNTKQQAELEEHAIVNFIGILTLTGLTYGLSYYPSVGNRVYAINNKAEESLFKPSNSELLINLGEDVIYKKPISATIENIFSKHCAVVGTTGSGKSTTVKCLIEQIDKLKDNNIKAIIIDPIGEYNNKKYEVVDCSNCVLDIDNISHADWFALLNPSTQSQVPCLEKALKTFKSRAEGKDKGKAYERLIYLRNHKNDNNNKTGKDKKTYYEHLEEYLDNFNGVLDCCLSKENKTKYLSNIVKELTSRSDYGNLVGFSYSDLVPLIERIKVLEESDEINKILPITFNDKNSSKETQSSDSIIKKIDTFLDEKSTTNIMVLNCSDVSTLNEFRTFYINIINKHLLEKYKKIYKEKQLTEEPKEPNKRLVLFIDEAHMFLNKVLYKRDDYKMDVVQQIAKEARKYNLNLVLATQRPKDIDEGILSQMNFVIIHKIINSADLQLVKQSFGSLDDTILDQLSSLAPGVAFLVSSSNNTPPLPIQITNPEIKNN